MFRHVATIALLSLALLCLVYLSGSRQVFAQPDKEGMNDADKKFVTDAAQGGMAEVKLGQLAADKASDPDVKSFGQKMVEDHGKANDQLKMLATQKNLAMPSDLGKHQKTYDKLSKLQGADFDKAYVKEMVDDHKKDVKEFQKEAERGQDHDVKKWAAETLPTLQMHLTMIQDIDKRMNGK